MKKPILIKHSWYVAAWIRNNTKPLEEYFGEAENFFLDTFSLLDDGSILLSCYKEDQQLSFTLTPEEFKTVLIDFDLRTALNHLP